MLAFHRRFQPRQRCNLFCASTKVPIEIGKGRDDKKRIFANVGFREQSTDSKHSLYFCQMANSEEITFATLPP